MQGFWLAVGALIPSIGVGVIFWLVIRWIVQADRRERIALARLEAAERAADGDVAVPGPEALAEESDTDVDTPVETANGTTGSRDVPGPDHPGSGAAPR